jgi:tRNA(adenine34) deaminase
MLKPFAVRPELVEFAVRPELVEFAVHPELVEGSFETLVSKSDTSSSGRTSDTCHDEAWMQRALLMAEQAKLAGEVPVGAVLVADQQLIAEGFNSPISTSDPSAHAEIVVMRQAANFSKNYRLINTTLYVTLEPCLMCAGALVHARIQRLVFGAYDAKAGAVVSRDRVLDAPYLNHRVQYQGGVMHEDCGTLLTTFFKARR